MKIKSIFDVQVPVVLASASPRRQQFLKELGIDYEVILPQDAEESILETESPEENVCRIARAKAFAVKPICQNKLIIAADTIVVLPETKKTKACILGKPCDKAEAFSMLKKLSGREHEVMTAVCLIFPKGEEELFYDVAKVRFHNWQESILQIYANTGESLDKAGGYAIQGQGAFLVAEIQGSWSTVVGLPVSRLMDILLQKEMIKLCPDL